MNWMWVHEQPLAASQVMCSDFAELQEPGFTWFCSGLDCLIYQSVCHLSIHMRLPQVCFFPSAACGNLSLQLGDILTKSRWYIYTYTHTYATVYSFFGSFFPVAVTVVPANPCCTCKASVLPYEPWHLISERAALKQAFRLVLKLALQTADKNRFFKKSFVLGLYSFPSNRAKPPPEAYQGP